MNVIRLLLVDDHPLVRDGLRARLGDAIGIKVVGEAGNAKEAQEQVAALKPDMVLMDIFMPDMNGIELTALLLKQDPTQKILIFSMHDNPEYVQRALHAGARGYVLKDAPAKEILAATHAVAQGGTFLGPAVSARLFRHQEPKQTLSARENQILAALAMGQSSKSIAMKLGLSVRTVEAHRQSIRRKLDLGGQAELIKYAVQNAEQVERAAAGAEATAVASF